MQYFPAIELVFRFTVFIIGAIALGYALWRRDWRRIAQLTIPVILFALYFEYLIFEQRRADKLSRMRQTQWVSNTGQTDELRRKLRTITTSDGISQSEAEIIAACYFRKNIGCGAFNRIENGNGFWIVNASFGYSAIPVKNFRIDKRTGRITSPIGPSYATPYAIFF
jgi:hypothetical protein